MKLKTIFAFILVAALAGLAGWQAALRLPHKHAEEAKPGRNVLYYQSPMHPWIKSDKPGKCTICGMDLAPVYEGQEGIAVAEGVTTLNPSTITVINVQSEEVARRPIRRTLRVAGMIDDDDTRHRVLSAYVDGRVDRLFVNYVGAMVREGEPLARIYSPALLTAEREYLSLLRKNSVTGVAGLEREQEYLRQAAMQRLKQFGLTDEQIAALPEKSATDIHTEILAPMTGTVAARHVYEGQYVKEGDRLFEISDFSTMWFQFDAYERDLAWIKVGQMVDVTTPAVPGKVYSAPITFINPNVNDPTRSAKVRVEIANPLVEEDGVQRRELLHKLYAEGVVNAEAREVLAVPRGAVLMPGPRAVVYVDKGGGAYEQRPVKLGMRGDTHWEVLDGLREGELIVTSGNLLIDAQAQLNQSVQPPKPPEAATMTPLPAMTAEQEQVMQQFLAVTDAMGNALAGDNFAVFNEKVPELHSSLARLSHSFTGPEWKALLERIHATGHLSQATDLIAARKSFLPLSLAVVDLSKALRRGKTAFADLKIYRCPMTDDAWEGAPKNGYWIQLRGPLRNPYFGSEMLECGVEVKP